MSKLDEMSYSELAAALGDELAQAIVAKRDGYSLEDTPEGELTTIWIQKWLQNFT